MTVSGLPLPMVCRLSTLPSSAQHGRFMGVLDETADVLLGWASSSTTRLTTPSPWLLTCWSARPGVTTAARAPRRPATDCSPSARMVATGFRAHMAPLAEVGAPPVRDTLAWLLTAVLGERMVIRETPDGGGRMGSFMRRFPELGHQPDIVLEGFDGRDSYTILEVKTCEPAGDASIARQHTDTSRGAAHRHLERTLAPSQYTIPAHRPGAPRLRLLTFAVSVRGALGSEAQTFIRQLSARMAGAVPYRLLDEASWATQGCAPLLRSAIAFSARRALAAGIRRSTCSAAEATYVQRCDDQPAADPACCFDCPVDPAPAEQ